jgi:hypothetical protein
MSTNNLNHPTSRTVTIVKSDKSAVTTLLLCIFLGGLGVHRFYVGKIGTGILMLLTAGGFGLWTLIDLINIACCNFTDDKGHYVEFERRSSSPFMTVVWVLGVVFAALAVMVAVITMIAFYATSGITGAARDQLDAIRANDYAKAYSYTTNEFQKATSLAQFTAFINAYPALKDNKDSTFTSRSIENGTGTLSGTVEAKDGSVTPIIYQLIKENGMWKIQNIEVNPANAGVTTDTKDTSAETTDE